MNQWFANGHGLWNEALYRETIFIIFLFIFTLTVLTFFLRRTSTKFMATWASLKSWVFMAPLLFFVVGLPSPWPLVFLILVSLSGAKTFFQMVGLYHRASFLWLTYLSIMGLGVILGEPQRWGEYYNMTPMIFLGLLAFVPAFHNSAQHMIQYLALSLMAFIFLGWAFLHMGRFLPLEKGIYIMIYIYILSEVAENISLAVTRVWGGHKPFDGITTRISVEGFCVSFALTLLLAWGMRHLLPDRSAPYWISAAVIAAVFGRMGHLLMSVIRRDLGIKDTGVFIIGRDDVLARMHSLIFVAPMYYYAFMYLQTHP